jgi:formate/nitrite transporter FocA (FNT family)
LFASLTAATGGDPVLSALLYPLGFVYIVIGGYQLYTENTLRRWRSPSNGWRACRHYFAI